ncbi:putative pseudouridine synthase I, TruA, pseudouridine synthase, catalytic domain superfamily [Dioscorea sansibarensis]
MMWMMYFLNLIFYVTPKRENIEVRWFSSWIPILFVYTDCCLIVINGYKASTSVLDDGLFLACKGQRVMCVELVANRFLRKIAWVLVATAIREATASTDDTALLKLMDTTCRRATAPPAPPVGLCLVDIGYSELSHDNCQIR